MCGVDVLFHQLNPLFSVNSGLNGCIKFGLKFLNLFVQFMLFCLILFGQHIEIVLRNASNRPVLIHFGEQVVHLCLTLCGLFEFGSLFFLGGVAFFVAGIQ